MKGFQCQSCGLFEACEDDERIKFHPFCEICETENRLMRAGVYDE